MRKERLKLADLLRWWAETQLGLESWSTHLWVKALWTLDSSVGLGRGFLCSLWPECPSSPQPREPFLLPQQFTYHPLSAVFVDDPKQERTHSPEHLLPPHDTYTHLLGKVCYCGSAVSFQCVWCISLHPPCPKPIYILALQFTGRMKSEGLKGGKEKEEVSWVVSQLVHLGILVWPNAWVPSKSCQGSSTEMGYNCRGCFWAEGPRRARKMKMSKRQP